jgi:hypothetical protein
MEVRSNTFEDEMKQRFKEWDEQPERLWLIEKGWHVRQQFCTADVIQIMKDYLESHEAVQKV